MKQNTIYKVTDEGIVEVMAESAEEYASILEGDEPAAETLEKALRLAVKLLSGRVKELEEQVATILRIEKDGGES